MPTFDFAPLVWWGLPLAAVPLVIHLLNRLRQRRVRWAAMEFLLSSQRRYRTQVLLRQILLLALRMAAVAVVVVALAQPRWQAVGGGLGGGAVRHVVVLDDSVSMGDRSGPATVVTDASGGDTRPATAFDRARRFVTRLAADLAAGSGRRELCVGLSSHLAAASDQPPVWIVPSQEMTPSTMQAVRDALAGAAVSSGATGGAEAVKAAARGFRTDADPTTLWIVGDFRSRDWLSDDGLASALRALAADGVTLRFIDCAAAPVGAGNLTLERLEVAGGVPASGVLMPVEVEVRNDATTPAENVLVEIREDGASRPGLRIDSIPAGGTATRRFDVRFSSAGHHAIEAALPGDVLPADDARWAVVDVRERVEVLIVDGDPQGPAHGDGFYVTHALAPGAAAATGIRPRFAPPSALATLDLSRFDGVWLLDVERLDALAVTAIEAYARAGGGVVFFCGPRTRADFVNERLHRGGEGLFPVPLAGPVDLLPDADLPDLVPEDHPVVAVLAGQRNPLLDAVRVERSWAVTRGHDPTAAGGRRLLSLRTGQPLAVERPYGAGMVVAVLTTAAPTWNNWSRGNPSWVVVMLELESHVARGRRAIATLTVGDPVTIPLEPGSDEIDVDFLVPPSRAVVRHTAMPDGTGGLTARLDVTTTPGLHEARWRRLDGTERQRLAAVNVDPAEGRLERAGRDRLDRGLVGVPFRSEPVEAVDAGMADTTGSSWAIPLLAVVVVVLLVEQAVAYAAGYHPVAPRPRAA